MDIKGINHIAINTKDIEASIRFYRDILGFKQLNTVENGDNTITYLEFPCGGRLELFDYHGSNKDAQREESEVGLRHFAFTVNNVQEHENELREAGVTITLPTIDLPHLGCRVLLFLDPNGVTVEFCESL